MSAMNDLTWEQVFAPFQPLLDLLKMDWTRDETLEEEIDEQERINALQDRKDLPWLTKRDGERIPTRNE